MRDGKVVANTLGKQFRRFHAHRPWTLQEAIIRGLRLLSPEERVWVLRDISFAVPPGKLVGVIGRNGAGKSTLLRMVAGVMKPDEGSGEVRGRLGALLEIGAGFHPDLTGRENVFVAGIVGGLTRREVKQRFDSIVEFSGIEDAIDNPLRTYSSGMRMRLGFSLAVHLDPDVILVDEVLAVGDIAFQLKCLDTILEFKKQGCAILLATHDLETTRKYCDAVLWLDGSRLVESGPPDRVIERYLESMRLAKAIAV